MSSKLPILAGLVLAAGVAVAPDHVLDRGLALVLPSRAPDRAAPPNTGSPLSSADATAGLADAAPRSSVDGQQLIAQAVQAVFRHESLSARIRLQVRLFEQNLTGTGRYFQLGPAEDKLLRLDLKIRTLDGESRLQQICDGRNLWLYQDALPTSPPAQPRASVRRVDLRHVHEVAGPPAGSRTKLGVPDPMVPGGLAYLLQELAANFDFFQTDVSALSGVSMWTLRGRWKPEKVAAVHADPKSGARGAEALPLASLPSPLPHQVVVVLAQHDLFPFQIQFLRLERGDRSTPGHGRLEPIVTMELFEVATEDAIDPRLFQFQPPADLEVDDQTADYVARLARDAPR